MKSTDIIKHSANSLNIYSFTAEALEGLIEAVKVEHSCSTCEALARTVMLDQTSHDAQRKPLTDKMREMLEVQGQDGTWNYDPYMHGMYNGMEYMLAWVEDREPVFREAPEKWLGDKKRKPLTDEEIKRMSAKWFLSMYWPLCNTFARAIEAAHGIKGDA